MITVIAFPEFTRYLPDGSSVPWPHVTIRFEGIDGDGQMLNVEAGQLPEGVKIGDSLVLALA